AGRQLSEIYERQRSTGGTAREIQRDTAGTGREIQRGTGGTAVQRDAAGAGREIQRDTPGASRAQTARPATPGRSDQGGTAPRVIQRPQAERDTSTATPRAVPRQRTD